MERDSRFEKGSILYFSPFIFDNGNAPKNKYFLVLQCTEQNVILASLPTSQDHVPTMLEKTHGCINQSDINFNCYLFEKGRVVCTNGFSFPKDLPSYKYTDFLVKNAMKENKIIIIMRQKKKWFDRIKGLESYPRIITLKCPAGGWLSDNNFNYGSGVNYDDLKNALNKQI